MHTNSKSLKLSFNIRRAPPSANQAGSFTCCVLFNYLNECFILLHYTCRRWMSSDVRLSALSCRYPVVSTAAARGGPSGAGREERASTRWARSDRLFHSLTVRYELSWEAEPQLHPPDKQTIAPTASSSALRTPGPSDCDCACASASGAPPWNRRGCRDQDKTTITVAGESRCPRRPGSASAIPLI